MCSFQLGLLWTACISLSIILLSFLSFSKRIFPRIATDTLPSVPYLQRGVTFDIVYGIRCYSEEISWSQMFFSVFLVLVKEVSSTSKASIFYIMSYPLCALFYSNTQENSHLLWLCQYYSIIYSFLLSLWIITILCEIL